ncbi:bacillithiol biosynthesis cysteine-adding enzyme BshC [Aquibacillus rhizosphaerae]|uniref:Putative cysteine ligase BshC n=1 Tax=Aquibacillus rhizosphaerae TaxID=3051431 RepID=A0ABT7L5Y2_9BACI|nr:bacillithiol biosynthesis cysteine-adding enzyme BshC [Aquibacillus sp. LR5S19]MDL4841274.1 bacillithiol biosynthesis cysteine-adding enzyme BshC [Aquibacillus sp. LR5S19]
MWIDPITLHNKSKLMKDYNAASENIMNKFDYLPYDSDSYRQRVVDLSERSFERDELASLLKVLNEGWGAKETTLHNIERLKDEKSVVVIGGQQAGLLTGPLYTIHKIISIIHFAKEKEKQLNIPVIPVFWIAGEDHDFAEINHIMMQNGQNMEKVKINHRINEKKPVSSVKLDKEITSEWLHSVFRGLNETEYTNSIYKLVEEELDRADSYVDFFARIVLKLFKDEGIVLIDSDNSLVRKAESEFFCSLIKKQLEISEGVHRVLQELRQDGYSISVDVDENDAHLFYHMNGERVLLVRTEDGQWIGKQNQCSFSTEELLQIAESSPELLSNNVVTRPAMQELLFPSLAFLGGHGEVGYWSLLKPVFHAMQIKMPPVLPRLSFTLVDRKVEKKLRLLSLNATKAVNSGVNLEKGNWLLKQTYPAIDELTEQVQTAIKLAHKPLRDLAGSISPDLNGLAEKNLFYIQEHVEFLQESVVKSLKDKNHKVLQDFNTIQINLQPEGGLQERCWNIIPFINNYGLDLIGDLVNQEYQYKSDHYIIYL